MNEVIAEQKPLKYIRFNAGNLSRPTWVHITSGKPFSFLPGRFGRWSTTMCGKDYEIDDTTMIKDEAEQVTYLCKKCAKCAGIEHQR